MKEIDTEIIVSEMVAGYARFISTWTYDGIYSLYNHSKDFANECMDGNHFVFTGKDGELLGYFCFGTEARIPTTESNVYDDDFLDMGLHIKPDLCGKKLGILFINACLEFAQEKYGTSRFRATVASFNERAKMLCTKAGFCVEREVTHFAIKNKFTIMKRNALT